MTETVKLSDLTPDPRNANKGTERGRHLLETSLQKLGAGRSILLDRNGKIIAGNKTAETAGEIGIDDVIVVRTRGDKLVAVMREDLDLDDPTGEARQLAYADNRVGQVDLDFDFEVINADIGAGLDLSEFWFDWELEGLSEPLPDEQPSGDAEPQISRADELQEKWQVQTGQLWRLPSRTAGQEHRLICGDCTDRAVVEKVMGGGAPIVIFTDPPYGVSIGNKNVMLNSFQKAGRNLTSIESDDLSPSDLKQTLQPAFELAREFMAEDCSVFVTAPQGGDLGMMMMMMMMMDAGLKVRHILLWVKNAPTFSMGRLDYDYQHEPILFTWGKRHRKNKREGFGSSLWDVNKPQASPDHPTMKPVELYQQAYQNHSERGEVVYDMYCGSGTAIIAAENLSRQCRAIEISPAYCSVILQRYKDAFGIEPELIA